MLNWEKCPFKVQERVVLGHVISVTGIDIDKANIEVIEQFPPSYISKRGVGFPWSCGILSLFHQGLLQDC